LRASSAVGSFTATSGTGFGMRAALAILSPSSDARAVGVAFCSCDFALPWGRGVIIDSMNALPVRATISITPKMKSRTDDPEMALEDKLHGTLQTASQVPLRSLELLGKGIARRIPEATKCHASSVDRARKAEGLAVAVELDAQLHPRFELRQHAEVEWLTVDTPEHVSIPHSQLCVWEPL